jgi:predicted amidohydrolase YtcJ
MYTYNGAYMTFEEGIKGSIEPGKLADLVILSQDILACPEDRIKDTQVLLTMIDGRVVHGAWERVHEAGGGVTS